MKRRARTFASLGLAVATMSFVAGCASVPRQDLVLSDPYEASNREALKINERIVSPISRGYRAVVPAPVRERLGTLHNNLQEPRIFVNDVLQGRFPAAAHTAGRFVVNSTVGIGGLIDVAGQHGLTQETGDFGQTLYVYGVQGGTYFVSPAFGPTTDRDTLGFIVDTATDPVGLALTFTVGGIGTYPLAGVDIADGLDKYQSAQDSSLDFYTFLRSSYIQTRQAQLREGIGLPKQAVGPASFPTLDKPKRTVVKKRRRAGL